MKKIKGSLTIEAIIAFTVFLSFMFMLLMVVKMSMTIIALDSITSETAKQIATGAYPIAMFNDFCDEYDGSLADIISGDADSKDIYEGVTGFQSDVIKKGSKGILDYFLATDSVVDEGEKKTETENDKSKDKQKTEKEKSLENSVISLIGLPLQKGLDAVVDMILDKAEEILTVKGNEMIRGNIAQAIEDYGIDINLDNLKLAVCKFPMSKEAYKNGCKSEGYTQMGLKKDDIDKNDVVIGVTYDYQLALPFLPTFSIKLKSLAIEHAWVNGGNGETVSSKEGIDVENLLFGKHYYVAASGKTKIYHRANCMTLYRGKKAISQKEAKKEEMKPCGMCKPK